MGDIWLSTLRSLRAHPVRFGLTSSGILWGAFMLTFLSGTMEGLNRHFQRELTEAGPKIVILFPGFVYKDRVGERGARVAFLGPLAAERLFGREPAVGRKIQIESQSFRVIGISEPKGEQLVHVHGLEDLAVIIPYSAASVHPYGKASTSRVHPQDSRGDFRGGAAHAPADGSPA